MGRESCGLCFESQRVMTYPDSIAIRIARTLAPDSRQGLRRIATILRHDSRHRRDMDMALRDDDDFGASCEYDPEMHERIVSVPDEAERRLAVIASCRYGQHQT